MCPRRTHIWPTWTPRPRAGVTWSRSSDPSTLEQRLAPGYYVDPVWSVRDVVGHIGTWLAEAGVQFERLQAGTYEGHDVDIDGLNAMFLEAMRDQPWDVTWTQANAGRTRMRQRGPSSSNRPRRPRGGSASPASTTTRSTSTASRYGSASSGAWPPSRLADQVSLADHASAAL